MTSDLLVPTVASSGTLGTSTSPTFGNKSVGSLQGLLIFLCQEASKLPARNYSSIGTSRKRLSQTVSLLQTIQTSWELERPCNTTAKGTDVHVLVRNSRRFLGKWCGILEGAEILYALLRDDCCNTTDSRSTEKEDLCSQWPSVLPKYLSNGNGTRTYCPSRASALELVEDHAMTIAGKSWIERIRSRFTNLNKSLNFSPNSSLCRPKICLFEFRRQVTMKISSAVVELVESLSDALDVASLIVGLMAKNQNATKSRSTQVSPKAIPLNVSVALKVVFTAWTNNATSSGDCHHTQWCEGARIVLPLLENKTFLKRSRICRIKHLVSILCRTSSFLSTANASKNVIQSRRPRSDTSSPICPSVPLLCTDLLKLDCSDKRFVPTKRSQFSFSPNASLFRHLSKVLGPSMIDRNASDLTLLNRCRLSCTIGEEHKSTSQWVLTIFLHLTDVLFCLASLLSFYLLVVSKKNRYRMTRNPRAAIYVPLGRVPGYVYRSFCRALHTKGRILVQRRWKSGYGQRRGQLSLPYDGYPDDVIVDLNRNLFLWAIVVWMRTLMSAEQLQRVCEDVIFLGLTKDGLVEVSVAFFALCFVKHSYDWAAHAPYPSVSKDYQAARRDQFFFQSSASQQRCLRRDREKRKKKCL